MCLSLTSVGRAWVLCAMVPVCVMAAPPNPDFQGTVQEVFVNNTQVLLSVTGPVRGACTGQWGAYNLTFDLSDPAADRKFQLVRDAFLYSKPIAGFIEGCGSSHINKIREVAILGNQWHAAPHLPIRPYVKPD